jgi:hypothetical protein
VAHVLEHAVLELMLALAEPVVVADGLETGDAEHPDAL